MERLSMVKPGEEGQRDVYKVKENWGDVKRSEQRRDGITAAAVITSLRR
jgi:hypothetical protein